MNDLDQKLILVVDDSPVIRESLQSFFSQYNFRIITCSDGLEGIQQAVENKPDLIFLDLMMPNFDGMKMLQVLKVIDEVKNVPVIVISGNTSRSNVLSAIESGADKVVSKPLQKEILIRKINELLGPQFLGNSKSSEKNYEKQNKEIQQHLCRFFLENFKDQKLKILKAVESRDREAVIPLFHELKGTGGAIGYPLISILSYEVENQIEKNPIDWDFIMTKCSQLFSLVEKIEYPVNLKEG